MVRTVPFCRYAEDWYKPVPVPELSHAEAQAIVHTCYHRWLRVAIEHGWSDRMERMAVHVWLHPDGSVRDSIYIPGRTAVLVLDTTHWHAGEECDGESVVVVGRVEMAEVRQDAGP